LYHWLTPQTMSVERELEFQAPAPPFKRFWLRFHSPGWNQVFSEMNDIVSTNATAFVLFIYFFVLTIKTKLPLYVINIEIFSN